MAAAAAEIVEAFKFVAKYICEDHRQFQTVNVA
jgi:hypothetical protein